MSRPVAVVSGMVAGDPGQGGATWAVLQYVLGLDKLGYDVVLVEPITGGVEVPLRATASARYFDQHVRPLLRGHAALFRPLTGEAHGLTLPELHALVRRARVLFNLSGLLPMDEPFSAIPVRVYVDLDPAFNQLWHVAHGIDRHFDGHTHHATVGTRLGRPDCPIPTCGIDWIPTLPPVVLDRWPVSHQVTMNAFTSVGHWRSYGSAELDGVVYGQRVHSMRPLIPLALESVKPLALALAIDRAETEDLAALSVHGWVVSDPSTAAGDPVRYRQFVQGSFAEFGVAKAGYVTSRCGWFSDRSACYLASGRPVLAQDTGFGDVLPTGEGLLSYTGVADAGAAIADIASRYVAHRRAARAIAERHLSSNRVLGSLLEAVGER